MKTLPIVVNLPDDYTRGIGRVMVQWGHLEYIVRQITYLLLDLDQKRGRVAVREPRLDECITMIEQLMELADMPIPKEALSELTKDIRDANIERDMIAHGIWVWHEELGCYAVRRTSGNWRPNPKEPKRIRKITPEAVKVIPEGLETLRQSVAELADVAEAVYVAVGLHLSSRKKSQPPPPPDHLPDDPKSGTDGLQP